MTVLTEDIKNMPYQIITQSHEMSCVQRKDKKKKTFNHAATTDGGALNSKHRSNI